MADHGCYFHYLQTRSLRGLLYRRWWLYPRLSRHLRGKALDVGCGIGDMVRYRSGTVGVDINPETVKWCRNSGLDIKLMEPNRLPFEDGAFESVLLDNVLEHIERPWPLLDEIRRVLIPKGRLVIGVPGVKGYHSDPDHKVYYDLRGLRSTVEGRGFRCVQIFAVPFKSEWLNTHMRQYCIYGVFECV